MRKRIPIAWGAVCAAGLVCGGCSSEVTFSRYDRGVWADAVSPPDGFHHVEVVLVENCPRDTTERARMIIEYAVEELISPERFQAQGLVPLDSTYFRWSIEAPSLFGHLKEQVVVDAYYVEFFHSNRRTKKRYTMLQELGVSEHYWGHGHAVEASIPELEDTDYIGSYDIYRQDGRYWVAKITVNSGITGYAADPDEGLRIYTTVYKQDSSWLEQHGNQGLVKYYNELREKKRLTSPDSL